MTRHLLLLVVVLGCADFSGSADPTHGLPDVVVAAPSFSRDVAPIFERRCALGGCHSVVSRQALLVLTPDSAHRAIVNQPSRVRPGRVIVRPGDALTSWLMSLIGDDPTRRDFISRMPLASTPLTPNQIQTIANWINQGAAP
jgi:hypothetical protein